MPCAPVLGQHRQQHHAPSNLRLLSSLLLHMPLPGRRDNCMNNTLTVGQPLQEHGFPPEVRAALVAAAVVCGELGRCLNLRYNSIK